MSYARIGPDSDVYLIGTSHSGRHVIQCCGCLLVPRGPWPPGHGPEPTLNGAPLLPGTDWYLEPFPEFTDAEGALAHLEAHRQAHHKVPEYAVEGIRDDDWLEAGHG